MTVLLQTEVRRALDTRSSRWLLSVAAVLSLVALILTNDVQPTLDAFVTAPGAPLAVLLPIVAVISAGADRSHRANVVTYTLVPRRTHIVLARTAALFVVVTTTGMAASVSAALMFVLMHPAQVGHSDWRAVLMGTLSVAAVSVSSAAHGIAAASVVRSAALSVVVVLLAPLSIEIAATLFVPTIAPWISALALPAWLARPHLAWGSVGDDPGVGHVLVSFVVWFVVPFVIGTRRQVTEDLH